MARTPEMKWATRLLMRVAPDFNDRLANPVRYWDERCSANDARTALSIACGAALDDIDPARGTHTPPAFVARSDRRRALPTG